ncbi:MAG: amino acid adenylation domain-containing protein [Crocosphaera sp.]
MNLTKFVEDITAQGIELWVEDGKLRYRAPKAALTSELLEKIKEYKPQIIELLKEETPPEDHNLSYGQKALWFLYKLDSQSAAYNLIYTAQLPSDVDISILNRVFESLFERHPVLRTTYSTHKSDLVATIQPHQSFEIKTIDGSQWNQQELDEWIDQEADRPFDLETGPVLRVHLLTNVSHNNEQKTTGAILLITAHHIAVDFWSLEILVKELCELYQTLKGGSAASLAPLNYQYADYIQWELKTLASPEGQKGWHYWQNKLSGELPVLNLPTDKPRPPVQSYRGTSYSFEIDKELSWSLKKLAQGNGVTLYMTVLTAFQVLLHRYSGQQDILIGSPLVGRSRSEWEQIVGYFVNPVVLRCDLSENPSFEQLLPKTRRLVLEALEYQNFPFPLLVERLQPVRDPSRSPLFQVAFIWDKQRQPKDNDVNQTKLITQTLASEQRGSDFDLSLTIFETDGSLRGSWTYNTDLFEPETIERITGHFQTLLQGIVANPQGQIGQLPILTERERQQLLYEWNDTQRDYPQDKCIHELFEQQANLRPNEVALVFEDQQLTYEQLNQQANQLAHYLQKLGVGPEVLVAICVERSIEMVVGLLGILKAGGAYIPLDPAYPQERLAYMLDDSQVTVLLTQERLLDELPKNQDHIICLDSDWSVISKETKQNAVSGVSYENLAYVIYTSGSTGQPKGVLVPHCGLLNLVFWHQSVFQVTTEDRATQLAGIAFDASVWELWPYLGAGAKIYLVDSELVLSPVKLQDWLIKQQISISFLPTPLAESLLFLEWPTAIALRMMLTGGDKLRYGASESLPFKLINNYGPTENTVVTTSGVIGAEKPNGLVPSIGRPISNTQVYILDPNLQPVPIGVPGELHISGAGLSRGYLNRPELTQQKFVSNPFNDDSISRLYKTGDLVCYLPDGNIQYLGRIDHQVKIRGFRIELGEIESLLSSHPEIQNSVVIPRENPPGNKSLVAYIVAQEQEEAPNVSHLKQWLGEKLPDYMVPSAFVFLEAMPLTPNGKIDRRALPEPDHTIRETEFVAPRTPREEVLAGIWSEVLNIEKVGIYDNFFELGGHSLLATQVISRVRDALSVELPLRQLFTSPTLVEFAKSIELSSQTNYHLELPAIKPVPREAESPLSFAQERLWFLDQLEEGKATYNMPGAIQLRGDLKVTVLEKALQEILDRHEVLRTSFTTINGLPVERVNSHTTVNIPLIDLQNLTETEQTATVQKLAREDAQKPFDLSQSPLVRTSLLQLSENCHVLLFNMHHIASDGWSISILIGELSTLYQAFCEGKPSPLPELAIQYADFAHWQRTYLDGDILERQLNYWQKQLSGIPPLLDMPTDFPRPPVQSFKGRTIRTEINAKLTAKLNALSRHQGVTLFTTLLAALKILLFKWTGQTDIVIGTVIAGRNRSEIEPLIGCFMNFLALRSQVSREPTVQEFLQQVGTTVLSAYSHQDYPFEKLVEVLNPTRQMSHNPIYNVGLLLQNYPESSLFGNEIQVNPLEVDVEVAKLDLRFVAQETSEKIILDCEYNTDLFKQETIHRILSYFETVLERIAGNIHQSISELSLLSESERQQLLVKWNDTQVNYPQDKCIHQFFEEQVKRTPDAVAVVFENEKLTYKELNTRANQLANYLQKMGVKPEVLVGICLERSLEMLVGLLGIIKAGGAYVPLDPTYPQERLGYMIADSQVKVLLSQEKLVESLRKYQGQVICLDRDWETISEESSHNLRTEVTSSNLAYVIYTSGSTGKPKGAMNAHQGVVNRLLWMQDTYQLTNSDRILQKTPFSFDVSVWEFFWPLMTGAQLVVAEPGGHQDSGYLVNLIEQQQITTLHFVPSMLQVFLEEPELEKCRSLRRVICSGEALPFDLQQRFFERLEQCELHNLYGPTEAAIDVTFYHCQRGSERNIVPIGRPVANTQLYILDSKLQPVPIGVPGELHIGGIQLARGYLNRPELTQQKFIPNPFSSEPQAKLYKTGDLARYLEDGNIEYLGRIDHQVKIRGFRIELGEIEAVLSQHPSLREVVVVVREDEPTNKRLVAYLVPQQNPVSISELREFLSESLPDYMVPSAFVWLEAMPLTPNGKLDRRALPIPEETRETTTKFVSPRTPTEKIMADLIIEVLKVEKVGIYDNFFELGGHSLLATQAVSRLRKAFGINLSLRSLFESPTIAQLTPIIENLKENQSTNQSPTITKVSRKARRMKRSRLQ